MKKKQITRDFCITKTKFLYHIGIHWHLIKHARKKKGLGENGNVIQLHTHVSLGLVMLSFPELFFASAKLYYETN